MISKIKRNYKLGIAFILGIIVSGIVVYAATIESKNVSYDNSKSGISATTMQGALDELYSKVPKKNQNFKMAYTYTDACITGEESSCQKTECYKTKTANSCKAGDIIDYQVNNEETIRFHVMYDKGDTLVMQSQENIVKNISAWYSSVGPVDGIEKLEEKTSNWINVEDQTYQMGVTSFVGGNFYTGCSTASNSCTENSYTWDSRTAKARMITVQEATDLGCTTSNSSCPKWFQSGQGNYWTMNGGIGDSRNIYVIIGKNTTLQSCGVTSQELKLSTAFGYCGGTAGANAVVIVSK